MLIHHAVLLLWTVSMVYLLGWVRDSQLCLCWEVYACFKKAWNYRPCQLFSFKSLMSSIFHCTETCSTNLRLHTFCWLTSILSDVSVCLQW